MGTNTKQTGKQKFDDVNKEKAKSDIEIDTEHKKDKKNETEIFEKTNIEEKKNVSRKNNGDKNEGEKKENQAINTTQTEEEKLDANRLYQIDQIIDKRKINGIWKYLIKWEGYGPESNTWEPRENICKQFLCQFENERKLKQHQQQKQEQSDDSDSDYCIHIVARKRKTKIIDTESESDSDLHNISDDNKIIYKSENDSDFNNASESSNDEIQLDNTTEIK